MFITYINLPSSFPTTVKSFDDWFFKYEKIDICNLNYILWRNVLCNKFYFEKDINKVLEEQQLNLLHCSYIYENLTTYLKAIKPIIDRIDFINENQDELLFTILPGITIKGLNYMNSAELIKFVNKESLYKTLIEKALLKFNLNTNIIFIEIDSQASMLNALLVSKILKEKSDVYVCIISHEYEHFSLNNMKYNILDDHPFFLYIDGIIKFEEEKNVVIDKLINAIELDQKPKGFLTLEKLKNFKCNNNVIKNVVPHTDVFSYNPTIQMMLIGSCSWGKCTFCIHNNKHLNTYKKEITLDAIINRLKTYVKSGYTNFTFLDEELSPSFLDKFCKKILQNNLNIKWQCRCRLDINLNTKLLKLMVLSGCIGILFGLETVSKNVLEKMNKYEIILTENEIAKILEDVNNVGLDIHVNLIFGFPGEELKDVEKNKHFITKIVSKFNNITCWVNLFTLFKESAIYKNPFKYNIEILEDENDFTYIYDFLYLSGQYSDKKDLYNKFNKFRNEIFESFGWHIEKASHIHLLMFYKHTSHGILLRNNMKIYSEDIQKLLERYN